MTPDDTHNDGAPVYDADRFGSALEFSHAIAVGRVPLPCWIRIGRTSMKATEEGVRELARGILLAELVREYKREE